MSNREWAPLEQEWIALQQQYEQYEKGALLIKLLAVLLCAAGFALALHEVLIVALLLVLWLQEGIFRTFQMRLGRRIQRVEHGLRNVELTDVAAFQLHSEWLAGRPGMLGLLAEYGASSLRPTVAFPYAVLLMLIGLLLLLAGL